MIIDFDRSLVDGKKILCALSGGADSMCLLHMLKAADINVAAAHFEHGIRGEESLRDLDFVRSYCEQQDIPFVFARADVPAYAREKAMSIEEAARLLRYEFLEKSRLELGMDLIATAHNLDDNAETLLFNLVRGSGTKGLGGIPRTRGNIVRPLLCVPRTDIEAYLEKNSVPHVEDSTNASEDYTRNLIRRRIMPLLREINPRFSESAGRTSKLCTRDEEFLSSLAADFINSNPIEEGMELTAFKSLHPALSSRVLRSLLPSLKMEHVDLLLDFCSGSGSAMLDLPSQRIYRQGGKLWLSPPQAEPIPERPLILGQELLLPECKMSVCAQITEYMGEVNDLFKTSYLKYEIIDSNLRISSRRPGDRLRPAGRGCTKSLKALFLEKGTAAQLRDSFPVIRDDRGILMVYGHALDERAMPKKGEKALRLSFKKL